MGPRARGEPQGRLPLRPGGGAGDGGGGRPGAIVNISSSAIRGDARGVHYSASKAGVLGMTRAMALALAPHRIRVNAIAPGLTDTAQPRYGNTEEQIAERAREIPLGRIAQPEEIARIAVFLASEDSGWITGELIHVNGGPTWPEGQPGAIR